jgi:integrase
MPRRPKAKAGAYEKTREPGVYRRNGVYVYRHYDRESKGRVDYTAMSFDQARELKAEIRRAQKLQKSNGRAYTVLQFAGEQGIWWGLPRKKPWKESTAILYRERVSYFIRDFGHRPLTGVTALEANQWAAEHPGRVSTVKVLFSDAKRVGLIQSNPFEGIHLDPGRGRQDIVVLRDNEIENLKHAAQRVHGDFGLKVIAPLIDVAAGLGCRPGELFAIHAADIDLREGEVHIWRQWNTRTRTYGTVKNDQLNRRVVMHPRARKALEGMELPAHGPIWVSIKGGPFKERELRYYWPRVRDEFTKTLPPSHHLQRRASGEIPGGPLDFYELRHKFGTELAKMGASPYEIAQQMGHTDKGKTAMKHYLHLAEEDSVDSIKAKLRRAA